VAMRFRRLVKLGPGVRLNVGKKSAGLSFGGKGYRYSVNTSGRKTRTVGVPGTGVSWVSSSSGGGRQASARKQTMPAAPVERSPKDQKAAVERAIAKPGLLAPGWESAYRRGVVAVVLGDFGEAVKHFRQASSGDTKNASDDLFLAFALVNAGQADEAVPLLEKVVGSEVALPDKLQQKYCQGVSVIVTAEIVPGIRVEVPFDGSGAAFLLAEHYQETDRLDDAIELVEGLGEAGFDAQLTSLSLAELYSEKDDWKSVVTVTNGTKNEDDITAMMLAYRAAALREEGLLDASLEASQESLRVPVPVGRRAAWGALPTSTDARSAGQAQDGA
jgi:hypothetical protein